MVSALGLGVTALLFFSTTASQALDPTYQYYRETERRKDIDYRRGDLDSQPGHLTTPNDNQLGENYKDSKRNSGRRWPPRNDEYNRGRPDRNNRKSKKGGKEMREGCLGCPGNFTVIARKGKSSVIMKRPPVRSCIARREGRKAEGDVLEGPYPGSLLHEGNHHVLLMASYKNRAKLCPFIYKVIVRKCEELPLVEGVLAECTAGRVWGSICNFRCLDPARRLFGSKQAICDNNLEWTQLPPHCVPPSPEFEEPKDGRGRSCVLPLSPENGYIACRIRSGESRDMVPDGSVCHFRCYPGYHVLTTQAIRCTSGRWNITQDPVCIDSRPMTLYN